MTLREFINLLGDNPLYIIFYFAFVPLAAWLANILGKGEGNSSPWNFWYSLLIYLVCVPGIFAVTLSVYLFLFEKRSIFDTDIYTQILPILSMIGTIIITKRNADLDLLPGFGKLSNLITMIACTLILMWFIDRTRIIVFSYMPFEYLLGIFVLLLIGVRVAWSSFIK